MLLQKVCFFFLIFCKNSSQTFALLEFTEFKWGILMVVLFHVINFSPTDICCSFFCSFCFTILSNYIIFSCKSQYKNLSSHCPLYLFRLFFPFIFQSVHTENRAKKMEIYKGLENVCKEFFVSPNKMAKKKHRRTFSPFSSWLRRRNKKLSQGI